MISVIPGIQVLIGLVIAGALSPGPDSGSMGRQGSRLAGFLGLQRCDVMMSGIPRASGALAIGFPGPPESKGFL
jgi:hypothetical protein